MEKRVEASNLSQFYLQCARIRDVVTQQGWDDVLQIMDLMCKSAEDDLLRYNESDTARLAQLHMRARTMREFSELLRTEVQQRLNFLAEYTPATAESGEGW